MDFILRGYAVNEPTWIYLSLLLILAVFYRFGRVWSLRNVDLGLLLVISPGLLLVKHGYTWAYIWLFAVTGLLLIRLFTDSLWKRRPLLEQNLNYAGMAFLAASVLTFLMTKVITEPPPHGAVQLSRSAVEMINRRDTTPDQTVSEEAQPGPAARLMATPAALVGAVATTDGNSRWAIEQVGPRATAVLAHLAVVVGLWFLGKRLFGDAQSGLAMATMYLLLPCTAIDVGRVTHVLPAALIVWAFVMYRRPLVAGSLMGLACGSLLFPVFLLPLWMAFYGKQGAGRFALALGLVAIVLASSLLLTSADSMSFTKQILGSIDWHSLTLDSGEGFWSSRDSVYRIPVIVAFFLMVAALTFFPREKNLEHLLGHSTAIVVATQLWYPQQGGTFVLWYLPLLLAVMFRPKLTSQTPPVIVPARPEESLLSDSARPLSGGILPTRRLR